MNRRSSILPVTAASSSASSSLSKMNRNSVLSSSTLLLLAILLAISLHYIAIFAFSSKPISPPILPNKPGSSLTTHSFSQAIASIDSNPSKSHNKRFGYVTSITNDDFASSAQVLAASLRSTKTNHMIACLVTESVSIEVRKKLLQPGMLFDVVRVVDTVPNPFLKSMENHRYRDTYTKLRAWEALDDIIDVGIFLDADTLVLNNVDVLFQLPFIPNVLEIWAPYDFMDLFNSGVMVFESSQVVFADMMTKLDKLPSFDKGDGGFVNSYYQKTWSQLPFSYCADQNVLATHRNAWKRLEDMHVIHYTTHKPWRRGVEALKDLHDAWWAVYDSIPNSVRIEIRITQGQ